MPDDHPILSVGGLQITFAGKSTVTAVNNISFCVGKGKTLAIAGESGSGKSLTALAIMGLLPKAASVKGEIVLRSNDDTGIRLTTYSLRPLRGKEMGMVFQEPMSSLNPVMTIGTQLCEAILVHQAISHTTAKQLTIDWLAKVQLPDPAKIYHRFPHELSGGQKQRVMIAMAMCNHPALLIADEPTTALDTTTQQEIIRLMHFLQQENQSAMIFITHDLALAASISDEIAVMYKGEIVEYGETATVLQSPQHAYTQALLACRPSPTNKGHRLPVVSDFLFADQKAQTFNYDDSPAKPVNSDLKLLEVQHLRIWFPENKNLYGKPRQYIKAVDDVSFTINKGEILGLVGESGCGKSTLGRSLIGLLPIHSGAIIFNGRDLTHMAVKDWGTVHTQIQLIFQDPYASLNPRMTIADALTEPLKVHGIVPKDDLRKEARRLLDLVQLPEQALTRYPHQFSGGQRQRIGIARALALRPKLMICDESVSALDVSIQAQILNLLKDLQHEFDLTYLFISHDLSVVHYISDRIMVMQQGKIVESGNAADVLMRPQNEYTKKLISAMP